VKVPTTTTTTTTTILLIITTIASIPLIPTTIITGYIYSHGTKAVSSSSFLGGKGAKSSRALGSARTRLGGSSSAAAAVDKGTARGGGEGKEDERSDRLWLDHGDGGDGDDDDDDDDDDDLMVVVMVRL